MLADAREHELWVTTYNNELKKRGGKGQFGSNLTAGDWGACARQADLALKADREAKAKAKAKAKADKNENA